MAKPLRSDPRPDAQLTEYESLVQRLGPVFVKDGILAAERLHGVLLKLATLASQLCQPDIAATLIGSAEWVHTHRSDRFARTSDPTSRRGGKYPFWSLLLSNGPQVAPLDALRLLLLIRLIRDQEFEVGRIAASIRSTILFLEAANSAAVRQHVDRLELMTSGVIKKESRGFEARALIEQLTKRRIIQTVAAAGALKKLFSFKRLRSADFHAGYRKRLAREGWSEDSSRGGLNGSFRIHTLMGSTDDKEEPSTTRVVLATPEVDDTSERSVRDESEALGRLFVTQLDDTSALYLHPDESRAAALWLWSTAKGEIEFGRCLRAQACAIWLLSGATCRSPEVVLEHLIPSDESAASELVSKDFASWQTEIPGAYQFWKPQTLDIRSKISPSNGTMIQIGLPHKLSELLHLLSSPSKATPGIEWCDRQELIDECDELKSLLRLRVCQRFSQNRWQMSLAISAVTESGEPCIAQILGGQRFGLSDAPLHYYSASCDSIQSSYSKAVSLVAASCWYRPHDSQLLVTKSSSQPIRSEAGGSTKQPAWYENRELSSD